MTHYIFSNSLIFEQAHPKVQIRRMDLEEVIKIRKQPGTDIYLCGGGQFAGWLLDNQQIDLLRIKLNPLILRQGFRIFGNSKAILKTELVDTAAYDHGLQNITYKIRYASLI